MRGKDTAGLNHRGDCFLESRERRVRRNRNEPIAQNLPAGTWHLRSIRSRHGVSDKLIAEHRHRHETTCVLGWTYDDRVSRGDAVNRRNADLVEVRANLPEEHITCGESSFPTRNFARATPRRESEGVTRNVFEADRGGRR